MSRRSRYTRAKQAARSADEALLRERLRRLGVSKQIEVHENRTVLVSVTARDTVRVHRGYAYASDRTLEAVVAFLGVLPGRRAREDAKREIVAFPVDRFVSPCAPRRRRPHPHSGDVKVLGELRRMHARLNELHFGGSLPPIPFRLSSRMRTRLGELTVDTETRRAVEIAINRRHFERDRREEVEHTVLHEMIHQWQAERGHPVDHGAQFKAMAAAIGVDPHAHRAKRTYATGTTNAVPGVR